MVSDGIRSLLSLMEPPPEGGDDCDWEAIAAATGWRFPADYRGLVEVFGAGEVEGGVSFGAPPRRGEPMESGILRSLPAPTATTLLMWGGSDVGESYYWRCGEPDPDDWTVVVESGSGAWVEFEMGAVEFLVRMLTGRLGVSLAIDMEAEGHKFIGWREAERELLVGLEADGFDYD